MAFVDNFAGLSTGLSTYLLISTYLSTISTCPTTTTVLMFMSQKTVIVPVHMCITTASAISLLPGPYPARPCSVCTLRPGSYPYAYNLSRRRERLLYVCPSLGSELSLQLHGTSSLSLRSWLFACVRYRHVLLVGYLSGLYHRSYFFLAESQADRLC